MNKIGINIALLLTFGLIACQSSEKGQDATEEIPVVTEGETNIPDQPFIVVLGIAQDAGFPQARCRKDCCKMVWGNRSQRKMVSCLALVDPQKGESWLFDATPNFKDQVRYLEHELNTKVAGIFLTHAHIGHYTGLMQLGREVIGAKKVPVYAMPRLSAYLAQNGPWSQLVSLENIDLKNLQHDSTVVIREGISITPYKVPHRGEFSETAGFYIQVEDKVALFIPDIDKWHLWDRSIEEEITKVDFAFLDGTFYKNGEIPGRDMSTIPHPFIEESIALFNPLPEKEKQKIHFIHFNHTNPVLQPNAQERSEIQAIGMNIAEEFKVYLMH